MVVKTKLIVTPESKIKNGENTLAKVVDFSNVDIRSGEIVSEMLANNAVTYNKLADDIVTDISAPIGTDRIDDAAITYPKLAENIVEDISAPIGTDRIVTGAVTADKLSSAVLSDISAPIGTDRILDEAVTYSKLSADIVTDISAPVDTDRIVNKSITYEKLAEDVVEDISAPIDTNRIVDEAVTASKIAPKSITDPLCDFKSSDLAFQLAVAPQVRTVLSVLPEESSSDAIVPIHENSVTRIVWYLTRKDANRRQTCTYYTSVVSDMGEIAVEDIYRISSFDLPQTEISTLVIGDSVELILTNKSEEEVTYSIAASPSMEMFI